MPYIEFNHIVKEYGSGEASIKALDDASFYVEKGELAVILGSSGAGKTTALNILGGMDTASAGKIIVDGNDITQYNKKQLVGYRRNDIGFVFQFYNLVPNLTALENVELAAQVCRDSLDAAQTLEKVGLRARKNNFPAQLSGGDSMVCHKVKRRHQPFFHAVDVADVMDFAAHFAKRRQQGNVGRHMPGCAAAG